MKVGMNVVERVEDGVKTSFPYRHGRWDPGARAGVLVSHQSLCFARRSLIWFRPPPQLALSVCACVFRCPRPPSASAAFSRPPLKLFRVFPRLPLVLSCQVSQSRRGS